MTPVLLYAVLVLGGSALTLAVNALHVRGYQVPVLSAVLNAVLALEKAQAPPAAPKE